MRQSILFTISNGSAADARLVFIKRSKNEANSNLFRVDVVLQSLL